MSSLNLPGYAVWPLSFTIPSVTIRKSSAPSSFQPLLKQLQPAIRSPLGLLSTTLKSHSLLHHLKHVLCVPDHPDSPLLPPFPISESPPDLGGPKPDTVFQVWPYWLWGDRDNELPQSADHPSSKLGQCAVCRICSEHSLGHIWPDIQRNLQVLSRRAAAQPDSSQPVLVRGIVLPEMWDFVQLAKLGGISAGFSSWRSLHKS